MEEGGVAVQRMQSRLSNTSSRRGNKSWVPGGGPASRSSSNPFGISRIRERAGSVFSPKKRDRRGTTATAKSGHTTEDEGAPPVPSSLSRSGGSQLNVFADDAAARSRRGTATSGEIHQGQDRRGTVDSGLSHGSARRVEGSSIAGEGEEEKYGKGFGKGKLGAPPMEPRV